jgi:O-antigen/teichoic acid export membrane protein
VIGGFNSTAVLTLNRNMELGKLSLFEFGAQLTGLMVMIVWAAISPTIWSLVAGNLASRVAMLAWSHRLVPGQRNRFAWEKEASSELISFGKWIFVSTALTFLAANTDRLMLGRLLPMEVLGVYTIAFTFADLPRQIMKRISQRVIFPLISRQRDMPRDLLRSKIIKKRRPLLIGLAFLVVAIFGCGDYLIMILYDHRYHGAGWMVSILGLGLWPLLLHLTINPTLMAIGKPHYVAAGNALKFIYMLVLMPTGYALMGVLGAIIVIAFNDIAPYSAVNYGLWKERFSCLRQDLEATLALLGLLAATVALRIYLGVGMPW